MTRADTVHVVVVWWQHWSLVAATDWTMVDGQPLSLTTTTTTTDLPAPSVTVLHSPCSLYSFKVAWRHDGRASDLRPRRCGFDSQSGRYQVYLDGWLSADR